MEITNPINPLHCFTDRRITFPEDRTEVVHQIQIAAEPDSETALNFYTAKSPYFHVYNLQLVSQRNK